MHSKLTFHVAGGLALGRKVDGLAHGQLPKVGVELRGWGVK